MSIKIFIILFLVGFSNEKDLKNEFYQVLSSNDITKIENEIKKIEKLDKSTINLAYIATLKMKKSNFEKILKDKISIFKEGANTLDSLIIKSPKSLELKFLRLIIQENAPKILKYNTSIESDREYILSEYNNQKDHLKKHIQQYAEKSTLLKLSDL